MISILENALSQTNQDEQLETLKLLKDFIKQVNFLEVEENHTGIKSHRFEYVWQDLIDTIGIEDKYKYLPQAQYYNLEDKPFNYSVKPLLPDTIVEGQNGKIYVLDAKYYRIGHLPDQYNIFKQVRYGEYVNIVSGRKDIINAFVLPANLGPNNIAVKGYAKHESETLIAVIEKRGSNYDSMTEEQKIESGAAISSVIPNIMALAESYPDLKANQNFMNLSNQLEVVEEDIANSRKYYNGTVKRYNMSVQTIPTNIIAGMFHFEKKPMFEVESQAERQNVKVKFD